LKKVLLGVVIITIVAVAIAIGMSFFQKPLSETSPTKPPTKPSEEAIKILSKDLLEEYKRNPIAADEKYKNKWIIIVGIVSSIRERDGKAEVVFDNLTTCVFRDKNEVIPLRVGEKFAVIGLNRGIKDTFTQFEDCRLVPFEEIKEFQASFDWKTGILTIQQFGSDLEVVIVSPDGKERSIERFSYDKKAVSLNIYHYFIGYMKGEYRILVKELYRGGEQIIYEERFRVEGMDKAKLEILKIEGRWSCLFYCEFRLTKLDLRLSNPGETPILVEAPEVIYVYDAGGRFIAHFEPSYLQKGFRDILLQGEKVTIEYSVLSWETLTTDRRGGEYQLIVKIYSTKDLRVLLQEMMTTIKVPPR